MFSKQQKAEAKKQQILEEIKEKAKQSTLMKGSKSVDKQAEQSPEAEQW